MIALGILLLVIGACLAAFVARSPARQVGYGLIFVGIVLVLWDLLDVGTADATVRLL